MAPSNLVIAATVAVALAVGATIWRSQTSQAHADALRSRDEARAAVHAAKTSLPGDPVAGAPDFALRLPERVSADAVVRDLQRSSAAAGVTLVSFHAAERPPSAGALGRLEVRFALRGAYPGAKSVLAEVASRHPSLLVQRASMRQAAGPSDVDTQVDIVLLTRPAQGVPSPGS